VRVPVEILLHPSGSSFPSTDLDIESEDDENEQVADKDYARSTPSASVSRPMTTRQAVLASVVDSTHVSLSETSRKKKPLNDAELALRREETARKRRNLTEKKLEDEKAETINRLLKKQSRPKNKRSGYHADDRTPHSSSLPPTNTNTRAPSTPVPQSLLRTGNALPAESNVVRDDNVGAVAVAVPVQPVMYRWISTLRGGPENGEKTMSLSFSVPTSVSGMVTRAATGATDEEGTAKVARVRCDVEGCTELCKYRLVKDWRRGACGMVHLKVLEVG